ncbi:MAG: Fe-S cluster assembly protein SufD [Actinomycetota bacterium]|nr:Fe-S cluster assembly protein SufD [Actinomycetota bacterium]
MAADIADLQRIADSPNTDDVRTSGVDTATFAAPTGREENWRFSPMRRLRPLLAGTPSDAHLTWESRLPDGVELVTVDADDPALDAVPAPVDYIAELARRNSGGAAVIRIPKAAEPTDPVIIRLSGTDAQSLVWGHVVVEVGEHARARVILDHSGSARYAANVSVLVSDGASLEFIHVQDWTDDSLHSAHVGVRVGRDARYKSMQVSLGGSVVRIVETVTFDGPGGDAELNGLYFADAGQHLEHRLYIEHQQPNCRSRVAYKGALQGASARTVWVGDVFIDAGAEGTDTYEINRNLVLSEGARADSIPNLEIETGQIIGAGHASATGRFDDEQLFYLRSRGIPADEARRLVVRGFFADLIGRMGEPELQERLMGRIEARLAAAGVL